jgi:hypothetical protein
MAKGHTNKTAMSDSKSVIPRDYADWLVNLKARISGARQRAAVAVNQELVQLYHDIGNEITASVTSPHSPHKS